MRKLGQGDVSVRDDTRLPVIRENRAVTEIYEDTIDRAHSPHYQVLECAL